MGDRHIPTHPSKFFYNPAAAAAASMQACGTFNLPQSSDMMYSSLPSHHNRGVSNPYNTQEISSSTNAPANFLPSDILNSSPFNMATSQNMLPQFTAHPVSAGAFSYSTPFANFLQHPHQQTNPMLHHHHQHSQQQLSPGEILRNTMIPKSPTPAHLQSTAPLLPHDTSAAAATGIDLQLRQHDLPLSTSSNSLLIKQETPDTSNQTNHLASPTAPPTINDNKSASTSTRRKVNNSGEKFQCHVCAKSFCHKNYLTIHLRKHTGERPFECHYCQRRFSIKDYLQKHLRTHTGEKPYGCHVCSRRFGQKSALNTHVRIHTGEKPYVCSVCQMKFTQRTSLKNHVKVRHPDQQ